MDSNLKKGLSCILRGYSDATWRGSPIYIKHFGYLDSSDTEKIYDESYARCLSIGIFSEDNKLNFLNEKGLWTRADEDKLLECRGRMKDAIKRKLKAILPSQIKILEDELSSIEKEFDQLNETRFNLIDSTAESISKQKSDDYFLIKSFFQDRDFKKPLFSDTDFYNLDFSVISEIKKCYSDATRVLTGNEVKKIALSNNFLELAFLTENLFQILNKPIAEYTFFQIDLLSYGKIYKRILSHDPPPPDHVRDDPEKLEAWYDSITRKEKVVSSIAQPKEMGGSTIVGATSADIKEIFGENSGVINLADEISKNGEKRMSMQDLIKLHQ